MAKLANHGSLCHHLPLFLSCADIYCHLYYHGLYSIIVLYHHLPSSTHDGYSSCSVNFGNISVYDLQNTHVAKTFTHNFRHECSDSSGGKPIFTNTCSVLQVKSKMQKHQLHYDDDHLQTPLTQPRNCSPGRHLSHLPSFAQLTSMAQQRSNIPSGKLTVCYGKWPIYSGFTQLQNGDFPQLC